MNIRVAIVEDDPGVRENLGALIDAAPGFSCVTGCASAEEAWQQLPPLSPDVVLMDINLPGQSGIACVARLRTLLPQAHFIMLTIEDNSDLVFESFKAGATGYLVKHAPPDEILSAVAEVHRGGAPMSSLIARKVVTAFRETPVSRTEGPSLSPREEEVLQLISKGFRSKEIADLLGVAVGTINTYVRNIYDKLHVRSRAEAVARHLHR